MASLNSLLYSTKRKPGSDRRFAFLQLRDGTILQLAFIARNPRDLQGLQRENARAQQACLGAQFGGKNLCAPARHSF